jgi:ribosomal-protein-alanine N-acetyltransferase
MVLSANNPAVVKYMTNAFPSPYDLAVAHTWIAMNLDQSHPAHFGIFALSAPDIVIGGIGLNKLSTDVHAHTAEVGFWIAESCWGKGLMTEALRGFTTWAFEKFEGKNGQRIRKLWAGVYEGNGGSMKCFLKCGYAEEGVMKGYVEKNGVVLDMHIFGMVKGDWESNE